MQSLQCRCRDHGCPRLRTIYMLILRSDRRCQVGNTWLVTLAVVEEVSWLFSMIVFLLSFFLFFFVIISRGVSDTSRDHLPRAVWTRTRDTADGAEGKGMRPIVPVELATSFARLEASRYRDTLQTRRVLMLHSCR